MELERCIDTMIEQLERPIKAALPPKHWRSKGEASWVEREVARREAATKDFEAFCVELLETETQFSSECRNDRKPTRGMYCNDPHHSYLHLVSCLYRDIGHKVGLLG